MENFVDYMQEHYTHTNIAKMYIDRGQDINDIKLQLQPLINTVIVMTDFELLGYVLNQGLKVTVLDCTKAEKQVYKYLTGGKQSEAEQAQQLEMQLAKALYAQTGLQHTNENTHAVYALEYKKRNLVNHQANGGETK